VEVGSSNLKGRPNHNVVKVRHRFYIYASSCIALSLWRGDGHRKLVTRFSIIRRV